jgi:hypothetical protein
MSAVTDNELRHQILELLHKSAQQDPLTLGLDRARMKEHLQVPENQMDFNIFYLRDKRLIELLQCMGTPWVLAKITAFGIDVIEDKDRFKVEFPFIQTNIQQIQGDVNAPVIQAVGSQVNFDQQVTYAFNQAQTIVESREGISPEQKEEIKEQLRRLEEELKSQEPDAGNIQKLWKWLKQNASWVVPTLTTVILEGAKIAMGK